MKKLLALIVACMLCLSLALAESDTALPALDANQQGLFAQAIDGLLGVDYEPIALLATEQRDEGSAYCFLARATLVYPGAEPYYTQVWVQTDAEGRASLIDIQRIGLNSEVESMGTLYAAGQPVVDSPDWVKALPAAQDESVTQLFVVAGSGMDKTTASISLHERDEDGNWKRILTTPGFVGKNGLCLDADHAEGCGQTPIGIYRFNAAFGIAADPGCALPYTQVDDSIYWSGDENQRYNEMVTITDYPTLDMENSEHIIDYEYPYQYCLNISFNEDGTPGRGSAIFLHCLGLEKPYTGGCVAIPEYIMKQVLRNVREDCVVVIDTMENLNVTF